jgi:hypothetical protein
MDKILSFKDIKNRTNKSILILFFLQSLIPLLVLAFYYYRYEFLPSSIHFKEFSPSNDGSTIRNIITTKENLFWKDILILAPGSLYFYCFGRLLGGVIPTRFELQYPKPKRIYVEINLLYWRSVFQYLGFGMSIIFSIITCEKIGFGSGLLGKNYVSTWGSYGVPVFILLLIAGFIIHKKRWEKMLASLPPIGE